jgi:hypothetical protein
MDKRSVITRLRLAHLLPIVHLAACSIFSLGYLVPRWQYLAIGWVFLNVIDFPVSVVALGLGWRHQFAGLVFYFIAGTSWWYLLGSKADKFLGRCSIGEG